MIGYRVTVAPRQAAHCYEVTLAVDAPAAGQRLSLPVWIPGSYLVREFARHLSGLRAEQDGRAVPVAQLDKTTWQVDSVAGAPLVVHYRVYAHDPSVRAAFLDAHRGFFNATSVCLFAEGHAAAPHRLQLDALPGGWDVATSLPEVDASAHLYQADGYDALIDHPVELGTFWRGGFAVRGVPHEVAVSGAWPGFDAERLLADMARICEAVVAFWHGPGEAAPPFDRYVFLLNAVDDGYGGLEHRASTALIAGRRDLPQTGQTETTDGYVTLLGLVSHEYFHAWNVKRLRPTEFGRYDLTRENHTTLLWFFEGHTSYYDDLLLLRAGVIDAARYLKLLGKTVSAMLASPGRRVQSVAAASFDAWTKYYRPDENTPNATVSYYTKGALVALVLDLSLRTSGSGTLDDVMRRLWLQSGAGAGGGGVTEGDICAAVADAGGAPLAEALRVWVHGTGEMPIRSLVEAAGVRWQAQPATVAQRLGLRVSESALTGVRVTHVLNGGAAERAGLSAGDELLAIDGWRLRRLDDAARWVCAGHAVRLVAARDQRMLDVSLDWPDAADGTVLLAVQPDAPDAARRLRYGWLGA